MLIISILISAIAVSLISSKLTSIHFTRSTTLIILLSWILIPSLTLDINNIGLYHSLFSTSIFQNIIDNILYIVIILILISINPILVQAYQRSGSSVRNNEDSEYMVNDVNLSSNQDNELNFVVKPEMGIIIIFIVLGSTILLSSYDLISIYLTLELQSFALYLIASIRTDLISSTGAGLKYFLLGAISSAFIILGISIIYEVLGTTNLQTLSTLIINLIDSSHLSTTAGGSFENINLGILLILSGLIFKISAAPFHNWFADVIQDVPTFVGIIVINIPKISVLSIIFYLVHTINVLNNPFPGLSITLTSHLTPTIIFIIIVIMFSLILGTVAGLVQSKVKRLLAFSTISHVGFILIAYLSLINLPTGLADHDNYILFTSFTSLVSAVESLVFYMFQYLVTVILTLIIITAYETGYYKRTINNITDLINIFSIYPVLTFTLILCLFSIAGIPPLTGFFAKYNVLNCALNSSSYIIAFLAIACSLISASYYMRLIKLIVFIPTTDKVVNTTNQLNTTICYGITLLTIVMVLYIFDSTLIINSIELMALSFVDV